jgi:outer membrane lipoprotein-sorting protein
LCTAAFLAVADDRSLIGIVQESLDEISSLQARFSHKDSTGKSYEGTLFLKRPWKMKLEYDAPSPFLIVADGSALIYEDQATHEAIYLPLETSPLSFLLQTKTNFAKVFHIDKVEETEDKIVVTCRDKKNYFSLVLLFSKKEKSIIGWVSKDAQGNEVDISLHHLQRNLILPNNLFKFQQKPRWLTRGKTRK